MSDLNEISASSGSTQIPGVQETSSDYNGTSQEDQTDQLAALRASMEQALASSSTEASSSDPSPESLLSSALNSGEEMTQEEGVAAYVEAFLIDMLKENLKKAGQPNHEEW